MAGGLGLYGRKGRRDSHLYVMMTMSFLLRKLYRQLGVHMLALLMCRLVSRFGKYTVQELCSSM